VDVNVVGGGGRYDETSTSLHHAVSKEETVVLQRLLAVPALDPNICASFQSPLCLAIREGNTAALRLLLTHKDIQINAQYPHEDAPICLATERGNADAVKLLVEQGNRLKINQLNTIDEETAVSVAVRNGSLYILHILLQHPGIDLNLRNRWGETALLIAVKRGDIELVKILLQDPRPISSLGIPAEVAKSCNNYVVENLIRGEIESKGCGNYDQAISLH
jgi:ankyrin repeat protein